jgi:Carbohydrate family 9 binding domain-like
VLITGCGPSRTNPPPGTSSATPGAVSSLTPTARSGLINPAHLDFLTEPVVIDGEPMAIVHIYSEYPHYRWVDASGEGIAAVDDVARAAIVYLDLHERTGDGAALQRARLLLEFVMHLQADDGDYFNFVRDKAGTINRDGATSYEDWGWWAARGQWALARGIAAFAGTDEAYAQRLRERYLRGEAALERALVNVGTYGELHGQRVPGWLLKGGTDVSSLALLGLAEYAAVTPNPRTSRLAFALGQAVAEYRGGDQDDYPFGLRPSTATSLGYWHAWGAHTVQALARAGAVFDRPDWVGAARDEADLWFSRLLTAGMIRETGVIPHRYDQIAYGQAMVVQGYSELAKATGEESYRRLAGLAAGWFLGDNVAGVPMYDAETGRGYDGLAGANRFRVNLNSGAESTIEALMALLAVVDDPMAAPYLQARPTGAREALVVEAERGQRAAGAPRYGQQESTGEAYYSGGRYYALEPGDAIDVPFEVREGGRFDLYLAHLRKAAGQRDLAVEAARAPGPVEIDGLLPEWTATEPVPVADAVNVLRGGSSWPGPSEASFTGRALWDERSLYLSAEVRDPKHVQEQVGPGVWQGDVLWVYLDTGGEGRRVDAKVTLAQTPDGPQVWNWTGGGFVPDAELAWREVPGGYVYEVAIPWASFGREAPVVGATLGFELGMGFVGGFLDWTGTDPDTASNLAPLTLVEDLSEAAAPSPSEGTGAPDSIAESVSLDGADPVVLPALTSPDRDYLWLEPVLREVRLDPGEHRLRIAYAGTSDGEAVVDAAWLSPVVTQKSWQLPDGKPLVLEFDSRSGKLAWR